MESHLLRRKPGGFFYDRELLSYPKARAFAKQVPTGVEAKINALLDHRSRRTESLAAAKAWGLLPSEFDALEEMDRAQIISHERITRLLEAHSAKVQREVIDADSKAKGKGKGGGPDPAYDNFSV